MNKTTSEFSISTTMNNVTKNIPDYDTKYTIYKGVKPFPIGMIIVKEVVIRNSYPFETYQRVYFFIYNLTRGLKFTGLPHVTSGYPRFQVLTRPLQALI